MEIALVIGILVVLAGLAATTVAGKNKEIKQLEEHIKATKKQAIGIYEVLLQKSKENRELKKTLFANLTDDELATALRVLPDDKD